MLWSCQRESREDLKANKVQLLDESQNASTCPLKTHRMFLFQEFPFNSKMQVIQSNKSHCNIFGMVSLFFVISNLLPSPVPLPTLWLVLFLPLCHSFP